MYQQNIVVIKLFQMVGDYPNPDIDTCIFETDIQTWLNKKFEVEKYFNDGQYKIYLIGVDRLGNYYVPRANDVIVFDVLGTPEDWLPYWTYRKQHIIVSAEGAGSGYQIPITVYRNYRINPWSKYSNNPILSPEGTETLTTWGYVVKSGSIYHMFYAYQVDSYRQIGHATSSDGKNWVKDTANNPVLTTSKGCWCPFVWIENGKWYMVLTVAQSGAVGGYVALSKSNDGIHWDAPVPIIQATAGTWDETGCESGGVIKVGDTYYVYYNTLWVTEPVERQSGVATTNQSPENWGSSSFTKNPNNPIWSGGRFCGSPFKRGSYFYYLVPHYKYGTDYAQIELYRDVNPTFYVGEREYLGVAIDFGGLSQWDGRDTDVPGVLCDNIYRDSFNASNGELWCYYSGCVNTSPTLDNVTWYMGLAIEPDIDAALTPIADSGDTVSLGGKCKGDFSDIRFTGGDGKTLLDYWAEDIEPWNYAKFWVKVSDDLSQGNATIYLYYGNENAVSLSDGDKTFLFFDDFSGSGLNLNKWIRRGSESETVSGGKLFLPVAGLDYDIMPWSAICYGGGKWVAVASNGNKRAMVSEDGGNTWTAYTGLAKTWRAICYSPSLNLFVAVGDSGAIATSPDGANWTLRTAANTNNLKGVCWASGLGLFIAVGDSGTGNRVQTSPDGINWTARASAADNAWQSVCWSPNLGRLVAVANSGTNAKAMYSSDGINWTGAGNSIYAWQSVDWSGSLSLFVAVISNGGSSVTVATSPDGINWTIRGVTGSVATWKAVRWSPDIEKFVAVANGGATYQRLMASGDGINWNLIDTPMQTWLAVGAGGGKVMCLSSDGDLNQIIQSSDGVNWSILKGAPLRVLLDSVYADDMVNKSIMARQFGGSGSSSYPLFGVRMPGRIDNRIYLNCKSNNYLRCYSVKDNTQTLAGTVYSRNYIYGYHTYEIRKHPNKTKYYQDEVLLKENTSNIPTCQMSVSIEQSAYGGNRYFDFVFVRKCIENEPQHGDWGNEQSIEK